MCIRDSDRSERFFKLFIVTVVQFTYLFQCVRSDFLFFLYILVVKMCIRDSMMTLIGTPPNLVIQNTLTSAGLEPLSFFSFLPVGLSLIHIFLIAIEELVNSVHDFKKLNLSF